jgi:hypothetical protein
VEVMILIVLSFPTPSSGPGLVGAGENLIHRRWGRGYSPTILPVPAWNADEALRIAKASEAWMEEHWPSGYSPTPEESERLSILRARQQRARQTKDMFAWQQIHLTIVCQAMASFRRFRRGASPPP